MWLLVLAPALLFAAPAAPPAPGPDVSIMGKRVADDLAHRRVDQVRQRFAPELSAKLSEAMLLQGWDGTAAPLGAFKSATVSGVKERAGSKTVTVELELEKGKVNVMVTFDDALRVIGLFLAPGVSKAELEATARALLNQLVERKFADATRDFDDAMTKALSAEALGTAWDQVIALAGDFKAVTAATVTWSPKGTVVDLDSEFTKSSQIVRIAFDPRKRVAGLFFLPGWSPPTYADPTLFDEHEVTIGKAPWTLPATVSIPKGKGPFPAVVLVHGSGPNDRDETLGANKPFRDLAWGLSSRKIAVLRYVKRTKQYQSQLQTDDIATVKEESIDDTRAALDSLAATQGIDPKRLVVLGHSLGGTLAPRIASADGRVSGVVVLAGATRPMGRLMLEQIRYLVGPWGLSEEEAAKRIKEAEDNAARLDGPDLKPEELVDGIPGKYWLDLRSVDAPALAASLKRRVLVLQGGRDYQVNAEDFAGWKKVLDGKPFAKLKTYPDLNHLFITGKGPSVPAEYATPGHVAQEVVDDIAHFIDVAPGKRTP